MKELKIEYTPVENIQPYKHNAKIHTKEQIKQIAESITEFGFNDPIAIDEDDIIIEGHGRLFAAKELGMTEVPTIKIEGLTDQQKKAYILAHNQLTMNTGFDLDVLKDELDRITEFDMTDFGFEDIQTSAQQLQQSQAAAKISLRDKFLVPPFTVLDARAGEWQKRKKAWNTLIQDKGQARVIKNGTSISRYAAAAKSYGLHKQTERDKTGASLLDPALAEVMCTWFLPSDGKSYNTFDCFAGDTAFGFVSTYLGNVFSGTELRQEQVDFNQSRLDEFNLKGTYYCDDGRNIRNHIADESQDLFFSCPPYYNVEVYSDKDNDASNQATYEEFYAILDKAFEESAKCLKNNRFAVVVVGDVRGHNGAFYDFPGDVKRTFTRLGFLLYNQLVLVRPIGLSSLFTNGMKTRKQRSVHEDVLVFYKGDPAVIKEEFGSDFLTDRQNIESHDSILVFYKGDPSKIKGEFGPCSFEEVLPDELLNNEDDELNEI